MIRLTGLCFLLFLMSCAHSQPTEELSVSQTLRVPDHVPVVHRRVAADTNGLTWTAHPCPLPGVPFRSYHSFAVDQDGALWARKSESAAPQQRSERPAGGKWVKVEDFFDAQGISKACRDHGVGQNPGGGEPTPGPQPGTSPGSGGSQNGNQGGGAGGGDFRPDGSRFQEPANFNPTLYYAKLWTGSGETMVLPLKVRLQNFLRRPHIQGIDRPDEVVESCPETNQDGTVCVQRRIWTYEAARKAMFGFVDLQSKYELPAVYDYYCDRALDSAEFRRILRDVVHVRDENIREAELPGKDQIVSAKIMNTEHTWPQSKFTAPKGSKENLVQKTDLHHIFPTDTAVNGKRANFDFAMVDDSAEQTQCIDGTKSGRLGQPKAVAGLTGQGAKHFEPTMHHRGNVARALFYFSVAYNGGMSTLQEHYLREWNEQDPPDGAERVRNEMIYRTMGVRNPFVDYPDLPSRIKRFCRVVGAGETAGANDCASDDLK